MKKNILQILILIFAATVFSYGQSNSWNNLTPLRSTLADVEKLLGKSKDNICSFVCEYETAKEKIRVLYAYKKCDEDGWNVPTDTVLRIIVSSRENSGKSFDELNLDRNKFSSTVDDVFNGTWTNAEEGLSYHFSDINKQLKAVRFIPKKSDNHLRCNGFPPYLPETQYFTMNTLSFYNPALNKKDGLNMMFGYADSFIVQTVNDADSKGYVLVYFDKKLPLKEYKMRFNQLKKHIYARRKIPTEKITVIEGGLREDSIMEFCTLSKEMKPPSPNPTLPSPQFMKKH